MSITRYRWLLSLAPGAKALRAGRVVTVEDYPVAGYVRTDAGVLSLAWLSPVRG